MFILYIFISDIYVWKTIVSQLLQVFLISWKTVIINHNENYTQKTFIRRNIFTVALIILISFPSLFRNTLILSKEDNIILILYWIIFYLLFQVQYKATWNLTNGLVILMYLKFIFIYLFINVFFFLWERYKSH